MERGFKEKREEDKSRMEHTRRAELRAAELRQTLNMMPVDKLYIDPACIPDGWTYAWIRHGYRDGTPDQHREITTLRMGWSPVPADRHPELMMRFLIKEGSHVQNYIMNDGLILCETPTSTLQERSKKASQDHYSRVMSLNAIQNSLGAIDPTMPAMVFQNQTTSSLSFGP